MVFPRLKSDLAYPPLSYQRECAINSLHKLNRVAHFK